MAAWIQKSSLPFTTASASTALRTRKNKNKSGESCKHAKEHCKEKTKNIECTRKMFEKKISGIFQLPECNKRHWLLVSVRQEYCLDWFRHGGRSETFLKWVRSENIERHPKFPCSGNSTRFIYTRDEKKNPPSWRLFSSGTGIHSAWSSAQFCSVFSDRTPFRKVSDYHPSSWRVECKSANANEYQRTWKRINLIEKRERERERQKFIDERRSLIRELRRQRWLR
jgi:hypothetical protein